MSRRTASTPSIIGLVLGLTIGIAGPAAGAEPGSTSATSCTNPALSIPVEEQRLNESPVPKALIHSGGLDQLVAGFRTELCRQTPETATRFLERTGERLWREGVRQARQTTDDRPLYWARLAMTRAIHQWDRPMDAERRDKLATTLDRAARGMSDVRFPADTKHVLVSGFDPFQLDDGNIRRSNPAGAAALRLDGRTFQTANGPVSVQAVSFPVLWSEFDRGIVEQAYGKAMREDDLSGIVTISQGSPGKFTIERWGANWRGGGADNDRAEQTGAVPPATGWPQPNKQFIETTLPYQRMIKAARGPHPVIYNQPFCQWPAGSTPGKGEPECHDSGEPDPAATAASGGGGDYLSNESMYRANRLRLGLGLRSLPGGHLHVPVLDQPSGDALTDPAFEARREGIVNETIGMIPAVAG